MYKAKKSHLIRVYFAPGESGWAKSLRPGVARLENIPISGQFNLKDIVEITRPHSGLPKAKRLVSRRFAGKSVVWYDRVDQFSSIFKALHRRGCALEGLISPSGSQRGAIAVAHPKGVNPAGILIRLGIPQ